MLNLPSPALIRKIQENVENFVSTQFEIDLTDLNIKSINFFADKVVYRWRGVSPTAIIEKGKGIARILDGKFIQVDMKCVVSPQVLNQG